MVYPSKIIISTFNNIEFNLDVFLNLFLRYASLLAELNRNCSKWIGKHVEESPYVILTPVFVDYFNYLILLEKNFYPDTFKKQQKQSEQSSSLNGGGGGGSGDGHLNGCLLYTSPSPRD